MLLGEKLIAFRDSAGRVGVMDHRCPHRCASLFLGRNEEDGLRCIYHGWKFDVDGNCVDMPSMPPPGLQGEGEGQSLPGRRARRRRLGLHGRREPRRRRCRRSRFSTCPMTRSTSASSSATATTCRRSRARSTPRISASCTPATSMPTTCPENEPVRHTVTNRAPKYHLADTPWGTQYAGYRPAGAGSTYWRFGNFLFPFWIAGAQRRVRQPHARARLGAARRRAHHVRVHVVEARRLGDVAAAAGLQGRHGRSAAPAAATACCRTRPTGSGAGGSPPTRATTG